MDAITPNVRPDRRGGGAAPAPHDTHAPHDRIVAEIAAQVRARVGGGETAHIEKGGVHHFVPLAADRRFSGRAVDVSRLNRILEIDPLRRRCVAEPGATFGALVRATLKHGLIPTVVPELEGITVGGAVAGCSVESMSWRYGGFHDSCEEYELVSGTGEVLTVSPECDPQLFHMLHGSYGTLAILTRLRFALVPAAPYVRLEYRRFATIETFEAALRERIAAGDHPFIDAIVHGPDELVLCLGTFVDTAPYTSDYRWLDVYYKSTRTRREDYLTTEDYCFRYDTECHWLTRTVPPLEWKPVRFAVGKLFLGSTNLIRWSKRLGPLLALKKRPDVVVDVFVPSRRLRDFFDWYRRGLAFYPLWLVPYRIPSPYPWIAPAHAAGFGDELFIDCAMYGKHNGDPAVDWSQALEEKTYELGGIKTLISSNHHTPEQFWRIYDRDAYGAAKSRLDPHGLFRSLYEKFHGQEANAVRAEEVAAKPEPSRSPAGESFSSLSATTGMTDTVEALILDLLEWVGRKERTYQDTMDAWRTSCPKLTVWEDATERALVETVSVNGRSLVRATPAGFALLKERRPHAYEELRHRTDP